MKKPLIILAGLIVTATSILLPKPVFAKRNQNKCSIIMVSKYLMKNSVQITKGKTLIKVKLGKKIDTSLSTKHGVWLQKVGPIKFIKFIEYRRDVCALEYVNVKYVVLLYISLWR